MACRIARATLRDVVGDVCRVGHPRRSRRTRCSLHAAIANNNNIHGRNTSLNTSKFNGHSAIDRS